MVARAAAGCARRSPVPGEAALRTAPNEAWAAGVRGIPTVVVGDGNDQLETAAELMSVPARAGLAVAVTAAGSFLVSMDVSVANAVQPAIGRSFHGAGTAAVAWTITAYAITFAATLVPAGRVADRAGRRRTFTGGLALFALGSVVCGGAPDLGVLIAGRVLQGAGAAAAQPASLGLLLAVTPPESRSVYAARWAATGAAGIALGPVVGGACAELASWRWAFLVNLPIVALAVAGARRALPETERHPGRSLPDPLGALALAGAAALATLAISELTRWGLADPRLLAAAAGAVVLGAVFTRRCGRVEDPVLHLELLRDRRLALLTATTVLYAAGFFGLLFSFVLFLVTAWGLTTVVAGLLITPMAGTVVVLSFRVGGLPARTGYALPLSTGAGLIAVGLLAAIVLEGGGAFRASWIAVVVVIGTGIALCYLLLGAAAVHGLPAGELAAATAINGCARQLGAALGVAAAVAAIGTVGHGAGRFHLAWAVCAAFSALAAVASAALGPFGRSPVATDRLAEAPAG